MENEKIKIGISACLLGHNVRYNGGSMKPALINEQFTDYFKYVSFCPEVGIGLGIPRETIRLQKVDGQIRLQNSSGEKDYNAAMDRYARKKLDELSKLDICGYILKKDSPTCGLMRVKVYDKNGVPEKSGTGLFAKALQERFPTMPIEEEGRLNDIRLRESFIERVYAFKRLKEFIKDEPSLGKLMKFHTGHKMQLMAHHPQRYRDLGHAVAQVRKETLPIFLAEYGHEFMEIMNTKATLKKQTDVLYHLFGFFKNDITTSEKQEFIQLIEQYKKKMIPLIVPITMLRHYLKKFPVEWLESQVYMDPFPEDLLLRSHL